jgi:hypothetical protein
MIMARRLFVNRLFILATLLEKKYKLNGDSGKETGKNGTACNFAAALINLQKTDKLH